MNERYIKWYPPYLSREFEMLAFGNGGGLPLILFPTSFGRYDLVKARVRFHISFTNPPGPTIRHDLWTYGRVAEGWLRRPQD